MQRRKSFFSSTDFALNKPLTVLTNRVVALGNAAILVAVALASSRRVSGGQDAPPDSQQAAGVTFGDNFIYQYN